MSNREGHGVEILPSESELLKSWQGGDIDSRDALLTQNYRTAIKLAMGVADNNTDVNDIVQDAFLSAHRYINSFDGKAAFSSWLYRIIKNCANSFYSKKRKSIDMGGKPSLEIGQVAERLRDVGVEPGQEDILIWKEDLERLMEAKEKISLINWVVFEKRILEGKRVADTARELGIHPGTVATRLFRAVRQLKSEIQKDGNLISQSNGAKEKV